MNEQGRCKRCGRVLKSEKSIDAGYGPVCKKKQEAADAEFEKIQITIFEELEYQKGLRA
ncbi:hypothetical protein J14TS2_16410 [Bacillus sp. J14TS2]|uniref:DUF6011 domain-containing protein n=1 Tax=Bacillus sp. J14TS2 TaxID=2807188 RepID=UPI001B299AD9|nr:DUF6011 domain-containing protein [Bacillus sp. J14TS2]GIN71166.1 hypothetical protein J14TS2_16410 [Bacillus sp. J14TS2]